MIIVTHEMAFARDVSTRTIFMDSGYVAEDAAPSELFTNPKNPRTREFLSRYLAGRYGWYSEGGNDKWIIL